MYASTRIHTRVEDPAEVARRAQEEFIPLLSSIEGFVAYYLVDAGGGVMCSTSVFEDRSGAEASDERAREWASERLADIGFDPHEGITEGEVVAAG
jgi:hypothetical protein